MNFRLTSVNLMKTLDLQKTVRHDDFDKFLRESYTRRNAELSGKSENAGLYVEIVV